MPKDDKPTKTRSSTASAPHADGGDKPSLIVRSKAGVVRYALPEDGEVTFGRSAECDVHIDDVKVSRVHAILRASSEGGRAAYTLVDLGSLNGTHVDGRRLAAETPMPIAFGETITLGSTEVALQRVSVKSAPGDDDGQLVPLRRSPPAPMMEPTPREPSPASARDRLDRIARVGGWDSATMRVSGRDMETILGDTKDERERIVAALDACNGNATQAAKLLGISRRALVTRMKEHSLPQRRKKSGEPSGPR